MCDLNGERAVPGAFPSYSAEPDSAIEAAESVVAGLGWLAEADVASIPAAVQAECLRSLERARSVFTAAHASVLGAFQRSHAYEDDGQGSARSWLRWQTQVTGTAASAAVGWVRRLEAHDAVREALAAGRVSVSWARQICDWTDLLPAEARGDADVILLGAAAGGAELADLARLAEEMRRQLASPDGDGGKDFEDRQVRLHSTLGSAGRLEGDLTPRCAEALRAVLEALGKRSGPEDTRSVRQRHHDALEEACRRLLAADAVPERAGQPTQIQLHISLDDLTRRLSGARDGNVGGSRPGNLARRSAPGDPAEPHDIPGPADPRHLAGPAGDPVLPGPVAMAGDECDATIVPMVAGRLDPDLLDRLTGLLMRPLPGRGSCPCPDACAGPSGCVGGLGGAGEWSRRRERVRELIAANAVALLSGPHGLASALRARMTGTRAGRPVVPVSLPLDVGKPTETIPPHLRRAVIARDQHCAAPGCGQPPAGCQVHHVRPRSLGGPTSLGNLLLLCSFHHLVAVHQWNWTIALNPDGTTTMTSPDGDRVYHSHSPPRAA